MGATAGPKSMGATAGPARGHTETVTGARPGQNSDGESAAKLCSGWLPAARARAWGGVQDLGRAAGTVTDTMTDSPRRRRTA